MRNYSKVLITIIISSSFLSCKKGEQDPVLSLLSRKARIAGDWTDKDLVIGQEQIDTSFYAPDQHVIYTTSVSDFSFTINKNGTWERVSKYDSKLERKTYDGDLIISESEGTTTQIGNWSFVGGQKGEYKNKERLLFTVANYNTESLLLQMSVTSDSSQEPTITYPNSINISESVVEAGDNGVVYDIEMLKSKEMIWNFVSGETYNSTTTNEQGEVVEEYNYVYLDEQVQNWIAK